MEAEQAEAVNFHMYEMAQAVVLTTRRPVPLKMQALEALVHYQMVVAPMSLGL